MKSKKLHYNTISPALHVVLKTLMAAPEFAPFRLVGGTALSLQLGHRESVDIDLFTDAKYRSIDFNAIDLFLRNNFPYVDSVAVEPVGMGKSYFVGESKEACIKLDVFYSNEPFMQKAIVIDGIRMAGTDEIVAMKIDVIDRGGRKKDFWDIHELKDKYTLKQMLELHEKRHPYTHDSEKIKNNLTLFLQADQDFDPVCLKNKKWGLIKLDIIDFSWSDSELIQKKQRVAVVIKTGIGARFRIEGGIDYINSLLYFRYNKLHNKQVRIRLRNNAGEIYETPVYFREPVQTSISLLSDLADRINDYTFYYIEISSDEDMVFEFWIEDMDGGFQ